MPEKRLCDGSKAVTKGRGKKGHSAARKKRIASENNRGIQAFILKKAGTQDAHRKNSF